MKDLTDDELESVKVGMNWFAQRHHLNELPRLSHGGYTLTPSHQLSFGVFEEETNTLHLSKKANVSEAELFTTLFHELHHFMDWLNRGKKPSPKSRKNLPLNDPEEAAVEKLALEDWNARRMDGLGSFRFLKGNYPISSSVFF